MDPAVFERELARFRVVRSRDYVDTRAWRRKEAARSAAAAAVEPQDAMDEDAASFVSAGAEPSAAAAVARTPLTAEQRLVYSDFWSGLEGWLALFLADAAERKAVATAFDQAHYGLLKALNLEDVGDLAAMMAAEVAALGGGGDGGGGNGESASKAAAT
jgi:hypothetical protein